MIVGTGDILVGLGTLSMFVGGPILRVVHLGLFSRFACLLVHWGAGVPVDWPVQVEADSTAVIHGFASVAI